jgi:hypothetical protein
MARIPDISSLATVTAGAASLTNHERVVERNGVPA